MDFKVREFQASLSYIRQTLSQTPKLLLAMVVHTLIPALKRQRISVTLKPVLHTKFQARRVT